jgi:hypothetical protein
MAVDVKAEEGSGFESRKKQSQNLLTVNLSRVSDRWKLSVHKAFPEANSISASFVFGSGLACLLLIVYSAAWPCWFVFLYGFLLDVVFCFIFLFFFHFFFLCVRIARLVDFILLLNAEQKINRYK